MSYHEYDETYSPTYPLKAALDEYTDYISGILDTSRKEVEKQLSHFLLNNKDQVAEIISKSLQKRYDDQQKMAADYLQKYNESQTNFYNLINLINNLQERIEMLEKEKKE